MSLPCSSVCRDSTAATVEAIIAILITLEMLVIAILVFIFCRRHSVLVADPTIQLSAFAEPQCTGMSMRSQCARIRGRARGAPAIDTAPSAVAIGRQTKPASAEPPGLIPTGRRAFRALRMRMRRIRRGELRRRPLPRGQQPSTKSLASRRPRATTEPQRVASIAPCTPSYGRKCRLSLCICEVPKERASPAFLINNSYRYKLPRSCRDAGLIQAALGPHDPLSTGGPPYQAYKCANPASYFAGSRLCGSLFSRIPRRIHMDFPR